MKRILLSLILVSSLLYGAKAQTGSIMGKVIDSLTDETIPGANVYIMIGNKPFATTTDSKGCYHLKNIQPGTYTLNYSFMGYSTKVYNKVPVNANKITGMDDVFLNSGITLKTAVVIEYKDKLIDIDPIVTLIRSKEIQQLPQKRSVPDMIKVLTPGAVVSEDGKEVYFRGSRNGSVIYYVDGVKQRGSNAGVPSVAISSMMVYMGGVPAKYGDFDGGVVVIETKGYFDAQEERKN